MRSERNFVCMVLLLVLMAPPALAAHDWVHDNTLDLKVLQLGQTFAMNWGFAGIGVRGEIIAGSVQVNASPTYLDVIGGLCRWGWMADKLGGFCPGR